MKKTKKGKTMSFKKKYMGAWYNANGEMIRNPKAYAKAIYGRPYKTMWRSAKNNLKGKVKNDDN